MRVFCKPTCAGLHEHYHLVRQHHEHVHTRLVHLQRLEEGQARHSRRMDPRRQAVMRVLTQEGQRVANHMGWLNREMVWLAARCAVEQAKAVGATLIVIEDLDDLEPTRLDKRRRTRVSGQVRGLVQENLEYLAARPRIRVLKIPPRGTSARCPRCLAELRTGVSQPNDQPVRRRVQQRAQGRRLTHVRGRKRLPHMPRTPTVAPVLTTEALSASARSDPPTPQQRRRACRAGTQPLSAQPAGHRSAGPGTAVPSPDGTVGQSRTNNAWPIWRTRALGAGPLDGTRYALRTRARFSTVRSCTVGSACRRHSRVRRLQLIC